MIHEKNKKGYVPCLTKPSQFQDDLNDWTDLKIIQHGDTYLPLFQVKTLLWISME